MRGLRIPVTISLICLLCFFLGGCGESTQDKMLARARAVKRKKDEDEPKKKPADKNKTKTLANGKEEVKKSVPVKIENPAESAEQIAAIVKADALRNEIESRPEVVSLADGEKRVVDNLTRIAKVFKDKHKVSSTTWRRAIYQSGTANPLLSWRVMLLPQLGYKELYEKFHLSEPWDSPHNYDLLEEIPSIYKTPGRNDFKTTLLAAHGTTTAFQGKQACRLDHIEDGLSSTIFIVNAPERLATEWTRPEDWKVRKKGLLDSIQGGAYGGLYVMWGSGRVNKLKENLTEDQLFATLTIDGGELISLLELIVGDKDEAISKLDKENKGEEELAKSDIPPDKKDRIKPEDEEPVTIDDFERAVSNGEAGGFYKYFAGLVLNKDDKKVISEYSWIPGLKRPAAVVRWGIAVTPTGSQDLMKNPDPIEVAREDNKIVGPGVAMVDYFAGDLAQKGLQLLLNSAESGKSGKLIASAIRFSRQSEEIRRPGKRDDDNVRGGRRYEKSFTYTNFEKEGFQPRVMQPGIDIVGIFKRSTALKLARRRDIDLILYYETAVKKIVGGKRTHNTTKVSIIDVQSGRTMYQSLGVNNILTDRERRDPLQEDSARKFYRYLSRFMDREFTPAEPPQLLPKHVRSRIEVLDDLRDTNPLKSMAEIRYYLALGLISKHEAMAAITKMAARHGITLPQNWDDIDESHMIQLTQLSLLHD